MNFSFRISWVQFGSLRNVTKSGAKSQTKEVLVSIHLLSDKTHLHKANVARKISQRYTDTSTYACLMEFHFNLKEIWFYLFEPASPEDKLDFSFSSWVPLFFFRVCRAFMRYISIFRFQSTCSIFSFGQQTTMPAKSEEKNKITIKMKMAGKCIQLKGKDTQPWIMIWIWNYATSHIFICWWNSPWIHKNSSSK